jgi:CMP-N-acetylneuraminic acid synthetase
MKKYKNLNILGIIPARGGSKGLPRKNIRNLDGKPLIAWTIKAALKSKYLNKVIVSTEDKEIAAVSKKYRAEVIERPLNLAVDTAKTIDVVSYVLKFLQEKEYDADIVVLLQPTSPLRVTKDIDESIDIFLNKKCDSVISFYEAGPSVFWSFVMGKNHLKYVFPPGYIKQRRQNIAKIYIPNGALYVISPKNLLKYKSFYGKSILPYVMPEEKSIDIDYEIDLKWAKFLIENK